MSFHDRNSRPIIVLLMIGGGLFAAAFLVGYIFDDKWTAWKISNVLHFAGGGFAVFFVRAFLFNIRSRHEWVLPFWMELSMYVGGALILGVFWEWFEFLLDRYSLYVLHNASEMTYADNIGDLIIDFGGALAVGVYIYKKRDRYFSISDR